MCGVWSEHWQADLPLLQPLKQCWQHSCVCFLKPASAPDAQHKDSTSLIDPCEACSEWNLSWKPLYDPGHCTVTQFQAVTELLIASAIFVESNNSNSQILREFFALRCHVEHPVVSMRELYSKNQIWTALKQDTFTFMHLADAFIQSDLHCIQVTVLHLISSLIRYSNLYGPVKQTKTWTWWIGHVALHG